MARRATTDGTASGITAPLRVPTFRALYLANLVANFGWLIQSVGAAWLMTSLAPSPAMVALVQTAVQAPILLFSLLAGVAADVWDRRLVLLAAQAWMLVVSLVLVSLAAAGLLTPWLLLLLTFALGAGAALQGPAIQAVVRELVRPEQLAAAVTLNAIAFNLARAVGPAVGGTIVAVSGAAAAFAANAVSYLALIVVLLVWRRRPAREDIPRERFGGALLTGVRYVVEAPPIRVVLLRSGVFAFTAASILALLPLVARELIGGGPIVYGVLLGAFGLGAMGGAFLIHPLRQRFGAERVVTILAGLFGVALLVIGARPELVLALPALAVAGAGWLGSFSSFNIGVQTAAAFWVQSRVFALYQMIMFGAMAGGSWFWGWLADRSDLRTAILAAGGVMLLSLGLALRFRLAEGHARDLQPAPRAKEEAPKLELAPDEGPVLIQVEYRVPLARAQRFTRAMDELGHIRKRNGALRWRLFQDTADAEHWVETFVLAEWLDHLRLSRRTTAIDARFEAAAVAFHEAEGPPIVRRLVARRHDSRFTLDPQEVATARAAPDP